MIKIALVEGTEAALALGDLDKAEKLLAIPESLDPGQLTPFLKANTARLRARLDAARGDHERVEERFRDAAAQYREFGLVFHHAVAQLEHAEWLIGQGRSRRGASRCSPRRARRSSGSRQHPGSNGRHSSSNQREAEAAIR